MPESRLLLLSPGDLFNSYEIKKHLEFDGFHVITSPTITDTVLMHQQIKSDFVVLGIDSAKSDGWNVLYYLRSISKVPVIIIAERSTDIDREFALKAGADDFIVKPYRISEISARIYSIQRRINYTLGEYNNAVYSTRQLCLHSDTRKVIVKPHNKDITDVFTSTEYRLLEHLIRHPQRVYSRKELLEACLYESQSNERVIDLHICNLRKKLTVHGIKHIPQSSRGRGYYFGA